MLEAKYSRGPDDRLPGEGESNPDEQPLWPAPVAHAPLDAVVSLPGSKSLMSRELVLSALATEPSRISAPLHSRDSRLMIEALVALGARIEHDGDDLVITPADELIGSTSIACGLAGTVMRFVPPVAALALGPTVFDGDPYARKRPMREILVALRALGADIADDGRGALPFTVHGTGSLRGGLVKIDASASSQFVSGLLLAAARFDEGVHVVHTGETLPSVPHIEMTLDTLRARGVRAFSPATGEWVVEPGKISGRSFTLEPDLSNAAPFFAAALVAGGSVTVPNWPATTTQVGDQLRELLPHFGATVTQTGDRLTVSGTGELSPVTLDVPHAGELAPTLIGLAALAPGVSRITGIGHIRGHETDRLAGVVTELGRVGIEATELEDGIEVHGAHPHAAVWQSYADHRMATTGALMGLRAEGLMVEDIESTSKTMPDFPELWHSMLGLRE